MEFKGANVQDLESAGTQLSQAATDCDGIAQDIVAGCLRAMDACGDPGIDQALNTFSGIVAQVLSFSAGQLNTLRDITNVQTEQVRAATE